MSKTGTVLDVAKTAMRLLQNWQTMKKSIVDIGSLAGKMIPKKEQKDDEEPAPRKEIKRKPKANKAELVTKALVNLGFKSNEARAAVAYIGDDIDENSIEDSIKEGLTFLRKEQK